MDEVKLYKTLSEIDKLTANIYANLINTYGETLVNYVIEKMIDKDLDGSDKFAYYIDRIIVYNSGVVKSGFEAYMIDVNSLPSFTSEENVVKAKEIHKIIKKLEKLLDDANYEHIDSSWISDKIDACINSCSDIELLNEIKKLYSKFLYKRNVLVEANLKLVIAFGKHFYKPGTDFNDLIQYGNMGLMKAVEKYNPIYNTALSTYSYHWIKQSITRYMPMLSCPVSVPYGLVALKVSVNKAIRELTTKNGVEPTDSDVANYIGVSVDKIIEVKTLLLDSFSLNDFDNDSENSSSTNPFIDFIEDKTADIEEKVFMNDMSKELLEILKETLNDKEYEVICSRYELDGFSYKKLEELGKKFGVTRERIRQIENKVVRYKLRNKCKELKVYI